MKWGTRLVEQLPLITAGRCALKLSARFLSGLSWINSRPRRSNPTYFYSGSSSAPGESDNLTYIILLLWLFGLNSVNVFNLRLNIAVFRPYTGLAPFYAYSSPWAGYSYHCINYNSIISEFWIVWFVGFQLLDYSRALGNSKWWSRLPQPWGGSLHTSFPILCYQEALEETSG